MTTDTTVIATPLSWLKGEIDRSLERARAALARALAQPQERVAALAECEQPVRQIRGALLMLDLEGAACFCRALENALAACKAAPARLNPMSAAVMDRSLFALSQFLDDLVKGEADVPLKLFPVYRELGELCGRSDVVENELFFPDLSPVPERARAAEMLRPDQRARLVGTARAKFQRGLIAWLKSPGDVLALNAMSGALDALDRSGETPDAPAGIWWVAGGILDLVLHADPQAPRANVQPLLARIERLMRAAGAGGAEEACALMREMLYPLALAAPVCPRVSEIKALYRLDAQLPEFCVSGTLEYDVSALAPVLDEMRRRLAAMEEAWSRYTAGSGGELARLRAEAAALKATARDLGHYRLVRLLDIVMLIASRLPDPYPAANDVLALEMAAVLLFMEGMLAHFTSPPADIDQQVAVMVGWLLDAVKPRGIPALHTGAPRDDITQRQHYAEIRAQVAREILANLREVEQTVDAIAREPALRSRIATLEAPVRQIAGALKMLGLSRANGVLSACMHLMQLSDSDDASLTRASLEWVADGLSCLGFYLENLRHGETPNEDILLGFVQRLSRDDAHPAGSTDWIPPAGAHAAAPGGAARTSMQAVPETTAEAYGGGRADSGETDLLAVYLQEARDLVGIIASLVERLRATPEDSAGLMEMRRAFHTLKGGARLVGLEQIGALAWEVEQTLNAGLQTHSAANTDLLVLVAEAAEALAASVAALEQRLEPDTQPYAKLAELARALRAPDPEACVEACAADDLGVERADDAALDRANDADADRRDHDRPGAEVAHEAPAWPADGAATPSSFAPGEAALMHAHASAGEAVALQFAPKALGPVASANEALHDAPAPFPADEPIRIGSVELSSTLYAIYRRESAELLECVRSELAAMRAAPGAPVSQDLLRAAHTLRSTSGTLGFEAINALAGALEDALHGLADAARPGAGADILTGALDSLCTMFGAIRQRRTPAFDAATEARMRALAAAAPPQAVALAGDAAERAGSDDQLPDVRLLGLFLDEAEELLPQMERELARWREEPGAREPARALARALHTLKGSARMAGAMGLGELAHALESAVSAALEGGCADDALFARLQEQLDCAAAAIDGLHGAAAAMPPVATPPAAPVLRAPEPPPGAPALRLDARALDKLVNQAGEIGIARLRIEGELEDLRQSLQELGESVVRLRTQLRETQVQADSQMQSRIAEPGVSERGFDPLELDRYTRFQELTRMMAESLHDVQMIQQNLAASSTETEAALALQGRVARDLQEDLVALRSVPFAVLGERLRRTVRQTARELGRSAEVAIQGESVPLERSMLQRLSAPLEHMLRNALAHGIEPPAQRQALGKPAAGRILIGLEQHGLEAVLTLADDGAGLDAGRIRAQATALGMLQPDEALSEAALYQLVFEPGLTTAEHITESSGRGVGLDVVRTEVAALGGSIEVASVPGEGTSFRIRLPLTLAAAQVLLLRAAGSTYAIPAGLVQSVEELDPARLEQAYAEGTVAMGAECHPLYRLSRLLGKEDGPAELKRRNTVLLLSNREQRIALHVDQVLRNQEAVLKPMGPQLSRVPGLAGATVLGHDQVVLVIDPLHWCAAGRGARIHSGLAAARNAALRSDPAHVLVVDDSLTVRRLTGRLLARAGYEVSAAKDGLDALQQVQRALPDLIVLDLEMPRMDGFELTRELRADPRTAAVPIVIVTSRLAEKHQRRALEMGADAFYGKPYPEDELLACVADLLGRRATVRAA